GRGEGNQLGTGNIGKYAEHAGRKQESEQDSQHTGNVQALKHVDQWGQGESQQYGQHQGHQYARAQVKAGNDYKQDGDGFKHRALFGEVGLARIGLHGYPQWSALNAPPGKLMHATATLGRPCWLWG